MSELFGTTLLPAAGSLETLALRLVLDLVFAGIVARGVYYRLYRRRDYVFSYLLLNLITFSLVFMLSRVPIEIGFALGLFGIFGILRYRTEGISVRDLTYLFVMIGIALLNAVVNDSISAVELLLINVAIVGAVFVLEAAPSSGREESKRVRYDRLDLLEPNAVAELLSDLRSRTHLPVDRCEIGDVDLLRDAADVTIYYRTPARAVRR